MTDESTPRWLMAVAEELDELALFIKRYGRQDACHCATRLRNLADIVEQRQ